MYDSVSDVWALLGETRIWTSDSKRTWSRHRAPGLVVLSSSWGEPEHLHKGGEAWFGSFFNFNWRLITLQYCSGFVIHGHESAMGVHVFPILNPPSHLPPHPIPKHVCYHMWNRSPVQVWCLRQGAQGWCTGMIWVLKDDSELVRWAVREWIVSYRENRYVPRMEDETAIKYLWSSVADITDN